jgi:uncharacterized membrane protein YbaN (DUF454 family)
MYIAVPAEILGIILPLLLGVAFLVLAERKVMARMPVCRDTGFFEKRSHPSIS